MLKLTKTGIGLLTRQYRSVLKKCWLLNIGLFALSTVILPRDANAGFGFLDVEIRGGQSWGVLNQGGYSNYFEYRSVNSAAFAMAEKPGGTDHQLSIQIDGYFYQNEGNYRVLDTSDIISSVTSGSEKAVTSGAVYSALSGYATKATTLAGYGITDAYTKGEVNNLISSSGSNYSAGTGISLENQVISLDSDYLDNNYYRKNEKLGILGGFEAGKIGNENDDNFSKFRAINGDFVTNNGDFVLKNGDFSLKNPSRLGAFSKCEKACSRPSERFPASLEKNSAFEQYSRSARGTFLFVSQTHKNVLDNFSKLAANDNFAITTFLRAI